MGVTSQGQRALFALLDSFLQSIVTLTIWHSMSYCDIVSFEDNSKGSEPWC